MSLAGGGCPALYPSRGNVSYNTMAVSNISTLNTNSQYRPVNGVACSQQFIYKESKSVDAKEANSLKPFANGTLGPTGSSLPNPAVVLYPREKICVHWHQAIPKREPVGLWNAGNSCFLNSVLQCLTFTPPLANYFMFEGHKKDVLCPEQCIMCKMQRHIVTSFTASSKALKPFGILDRLQAIARHMERYKQEDAHEFLRCLIDAMQKRLLVSCNHLDHYSQETTLLHQIFGGYLRSQVVCDVCKSVSNTYEAFLDISLEVKDVSNLHQALDAYTRREVLDRENSYSCESCQRKVRAYKRLMIHSPPNVLTLQLKRYMGAGAGYKLNRHLSFPVQLDLQPFVTEVNESSLRYRLYAVLVHYGMTTTSGHYYCFVVAPSGQWYKVNDATVTPVSSMDVLREEAYMLFYVRHPSLPRTSGNIHNGTTAKLQPSTVSCSRSVSGERVVQNGLNGVQHNVKSNVTPLQKPICSSKPSVTPMQKPVCSSAVVTTAKVQVPTLTVKPLMPVVTTSLTTVSSAPPCTAGELKRPLQSSESRKKISFHWNSRTLPASCKLAMSKAAESAEGSKLVPYDDGASDESDIEKERVELTVNESVTSVPETQVVDEKSSVSDSEKIRVSSIQSSDGDLKSAQSVVISSANHATTSTETVLSSSDNNHSIGIVLESTSSSLLLGTCEAEQSIQTTSGLLSRKREDKPPTITDSDTRSCSKHVDDAEKLKTVYQSHSNHAVYKSSGSSRKRRARSKHRRHHTKHRRHHLTPTSSAEDVEYIWVEKTAETIAHQCSDDHITNLGCTSSVQHYPTTQVINNKNHRRHDGNSESYVALHDCDVKCLENQDKVHSDGSYSRYKPSAPSSGDGRNVDESDMSGHTESSSGECRKHSSNLSCDNDRRLSASATCSLGCYNGDDTLSYHHHHHRRTFVSPVRRRNHRYVSWHRSDHIHGNERHERSEQHHRSRAHSQSRDRNCDRDEYRRPSHSAASCHRHYSHH